MLTSSHAWLEPDLMDIVRLFEGAETLEIAHTCAKQGEKVVNTFTVDGDTQTAEHVMQKGDEKSLLKRYAKLALYRILSEKYQKTLPWGSLTGIRPTRLAYPFAERGEDFQPFFEEMGVSQENIALLSRVIKGQAGIYERKEGNCDLYVSLPFCPTRCVYCSFITAPIDKTKQYLSAYLEAIEKELSALPKIKKIRSVYVGGGTPFVLNEGDLERVLKAVAPFAKGVEFTVEAGRPDVFTKGKLELCKQYGVTRICINAQSFSDKTLQTIGRAHTAAQVREAFGLAKPYGFVINCDLIAGLTGESLQEFCDSVDSAIALAPENITVHTLCLKKGARLKEQTEALGEGKLSEMIAYSRKALTKAGFEPYYLYRQKYMAGAHENVGWAKGNTASVYNIDVMEESADNVAVGANAITKHVILSENRIERYGSPKDIPTYLQKVDTIIQEKQKLFL